MAVPSAVEPHATSIHMPRARTVPSLANVHCCALLVLHRAICNGAPSKGSLAGISRQWPLPTPMSCPVHTSATATVGVVVPGVVAAAAVAPLGAGAEPAREVQPVLVGVP